LIVLPSDYDVVIYTDGACSGNPGPGGWAAILKHPASGKVQTLTGGAPDTTNNRMELTAPIEGMRSLKSGRRWKVEVVSDSEYLVRGMTEWLPGWIARGWRRGGKAKGQPVKNEDLWKALHELSGRLEVTFTHVRGHAGHPENEECDRLAVAAIGPFRKRR
jgi:ribonuclease HI